MNGKSLPELVSPNELEKRYALRHGGVLDLLTLAKIKPAWTRKTGRGTMKLFKRDEVLPVIEKHIAEKNPVSNPAPAKDQLHSVVARLDEQDEHLQTLIKGNQALFGLVQQMAGQVKALHDALGGKA